MVIGNINNNKWGSVDDILGMNGNVNRIKRKIRVRSSFLPDYLDSIGVCIFLFFLRVFILYLFYFILFYSYLI